MNLLIETLQKRDKFSSALLYPVYFLLGLSHKKQNMIKYNKLSHISWKCLSHKTFIEETIHELIN